MNPDTFIGLWRILIIALFLRSAIYHVRLRQYLQMIGWLVFCQVVLQGIDAMQMLWWDVANRATK